MQEKACISMSSSTKKSKAGEGVSSIQKTFSCALCLYKDYLCSSDTVGGKVDFRVSTASQNSWVCPLERQDCHFCFSKKTILVHSVFN